MPRPLDDGWTFETTAAELLAGDDARAAQTAIAVRVWGLGAEPWPKEADEAMAAFVKARKVGPAARTIFVSQLSAAELAERCPKVWALATQADPWCVVAPRPVVES